MLDDAGTSPPIEDTPNQVPNPLVPLPMPAEDVVRNLDAVVITHLHEDHFDETAARLLPGTCPSSVSPRTRPRSPSTACSCARWRPRSTGTVSRSPEPADSTAPARSPASSRP